MIKYKVTNLVYLRISKVEIIRETKCFVFVQRTDWDDKPMAGKFRQDAKITEYHAYFDTYEEARNYGLHIIEEEMIKFHKRSVCAMSKFNDIGTAYDKLLGETEYVG